MFGMLKRVSKHNQYNRNSLNQTYLSIFCLILLCVPPHPPRIASMNTHASRSEIWAVEIRNAA